MSLRQLRHYGARDPFERRRLAVDRAPELDGEGGARECPPRTQHGRGIVDGSLVSAAGIDPRDVLLIRVGRARRGRSRRGRSRTQVCEEIACRRTRLEDLPEDGGSSPERGGRDLFPRLDAEGGSQRAGAEVVEILRRGKDAGSRLEEEAQAELG